MALIFNYGCMGSAKTAQALITKYNYEERGLKTLLLKPATDTRDGATLVKSRMGLEATAVIVASDLNLLSYMETAGKIDVVLVDEAQFLSPAQVDQLARLSLGRKLTVLCYGLATDFRTEFFPGSKRLFEIADELHEITSICKCGCKAKVNARLDGNGHVVKTGEQVMLGGNDRYTAMCLKCWLLAE